MKCGICGKYKSEYSICDECIETGRDIGLTKLRDKGK